LYPKFSFFIIYFCFLFYSKSTIEVIDLKNKTISVIEPTCKSIGDRIFFCATPWDIRDDEHSIFVTYGRSNPSKLFKSMARLSFNTQMKAEELNETNVSIESVGPIVESESIDANELGRFRHSACVTANSNLFIYGGKVFEQEKSGSRVLNDGYIMDKFSNLKKINVTLFFI